MKARTRAALAGWLWCGGLQIACAATYSRTETIEYHDDPQLWVLGQVKRSTVNGIEAQRTTFDARAQPVEVFDFGQRTSSHGYHADGAPAVTVDGNGHVVRFHDYKRGIPQRIVLADGAVFSAQVDDNGWLTSSTDASGAVTCYAYDAMGRRVLTTYPSESFPGRCDESTWAADRSQFRPLMAHDPKPAGFVAGQWVHTRWRGDYRRETYMDALWRPVLEVEYDNSDRAGTLRTRGTEYDAQGRVVFQSHPSGDAAPPALGTWTAYDALGRVTQVILDSEQGPLTTRTDYLSGGRTRVTNPRGFATQVEYQQFDTPSYAAPVRILHPEGAVTDIVRDAWGKPLRIVRSDTSGAERVERVLVYDSQQRLCKTMEPETGTTVLTYDAAGNLTWSVAGVALPSAQACDREAAANSGRMVIRRYDMRNRLSQLLFPDGRGDQRWSYTAAGQPLRITTWNDGAGSGPVVNHYAYNARGLLVTETLEQPGWYAWPTRYSYDAHGVVSAITYPTYRHVRLYPNALGQSTGVDDTEGNVYARHVRYHPAGDLSQYTYGNGIVRQIARTPSGQPARILDSAGVLDVQQEYDANGNVVYQYDGLDAGRSRHLRYDGLDRLTAAGSSAFGGDHWHRFTYDRLDNLMSWTLGGVKDHARYEHDASNRLTSIRNSAGATVAGFSYDVQGNVHNHNGRVYDFDLGNRLREAIGYEWYRYDGWGRRVLTQRSGGIPVLSLYNRQGVLLYQADDSRGIASEHVYLAGQLLVTRERPYSSPNAQLHYQHPDALGSPVAVTDEAGRLRRRTQYDPFGNVIGQPRHDDIGYTGHVQDGATGLTYMQQRYQMPEIGRFLSVDPVTAYAQPGVNFNRYWYANNNPYKLIDPDGREAYLHWSSHNQVNLVVKYRIDRTSGQTKLASDTINNKFSQLFSGNVSLGGTSISVKATAVQDDSANVIVKMEGSGATTRSGRAETDKIGGNFVTMPSSASSDVFGHELGHVAGAGDQYLSGVSANGLEVSVPGPGNNIMQDFRGPANEQSLKEIIVAPTNSNTCAPGIASANGAC